MDTTSVPIVPNDVIKSLKKVLNAVLMAALPASAVYDVVSPALHPCAFPDALVVTVLALTGVMAFSVIPSNKVSTEESRSLYVMDPNSDVILCLRDS